MSSFLAYPSLMSNSPISSFGVWLWFMLVSRIGDAIGCACACQGCPDFLRSGSKARKMTVEMVGAGRPPPRFAGRVILCSYQCRGRVVKRRLTARSGKGDLVAKRGLSAPPPKCTEIRRSVQFMPISGNDCLLVRVLKEHSSTFLHFVLKFF